jgi:hypothetical protein
MAHIRVYDPRGFEFEITVENLLYILQECTSVKGKGLEGEFVYAWDKKDLVLLPVSSQEYVSCADFTAGLSKKVSKSDMKEGCVYITKKQEHVIYLGKQQWFGGTFYDWKDSASKSVWSFEDKGERHVFAFIDEEKRSCDKWFCDTGFTKISSKVSDVISTEYAKKFEEFKDSYEGSGIKFPEFKVNNMKTARIYGKESVVVMIDNEFFEVNLVCRSSYWHNYDDSNIELTRVNKLAIVNDKLKVTPCNEDGVEVKLREFNKLQKYDLVGKVTKKNHPVQVSF